MITTGEITPKHHTNINADNNIAGYIGTAKADLAMVA